MDCLTLLHGLRYALDHGGRLPGNEVGSRCLRMLTKQQKDGQGTKP